MEEYEKRKIEESIYSIQDRMESIKNEMMSDKPHKYYILRKIESIINYAKCIKNICESEER